MSNYKAIAKKIKSVSQEQDPLTAVFYGEPGTGKTTLLGTFPKVIHLDIREKGSKVLKKIKGLKTIAIDSVQELEDMYWYLLKEKHDYETVGIDTVGGAQLLMIEEIMRKKKKKGKPGDWGSMSMGMWGDVATKAKELFINYRDLRDEGMNVAFLAHRRIFKVNEDEDDDDQTISRIAPHMGPALSPSIVNVLNAAVDIVGETYIGEKYKIIKDLKTGKKREEKSINYYLRIGPNSSYITKVRRPKGDKLPDSLKDPEYSDLLELME